jgi:hypothetical protein
VPALKTISGFPTKLLSTNVAYPLALAYAFEQATRQRRPPPLE